MYLYSSDITLIERDLILPRLGTTIGAAEILDPTSSVSIVTWSEVSWLSSEVCGGVCARAVYSVVNRTALCFVSANLT